METSRSILFHFPYSAWRASCSVLCWEASEDRTTPGLEIMLYKSLFQFCQWVLLKYFKLHFSDGKWGPDEAGWVAKRDRTKNEMYVCMGRWWQRKHRFSTKTILTSGILVKSFRLMEAPTRTARNSKYSRKYYKMVERII